MGSVTTLSMCSVLCLTLVLSKLADAGFLESFCAVNCNRGRGGNLCKCNGFHFAGKRTLTDDYLKSKDDLFSLAKNELTHSDLDLSTLESELSDGSLGDGRLREGNYVNDHQRKDQAKEFLEWLLLKLKQREENRGGFGALRDISDGLTD